MKKYPRRIKTIKRVNKRVRSKTTHDEVEAGRVVIKTIKKPRKRKD